MNKIGPLPKTRFHPVHLLPSCTIMFPSSPRNRAKTEQDDQDEDRMIRMKTG